MAAPLTPLRRYAAPPNSPAHRTIWDRAAECGIDKPPSSILSPSRTTIASSLDYARDRGGLTPSDQADGREEMPKPRVENTVVKKEPYVEINKYTGRIDPRTFRKSTASKVSGHDNILTVFVAAQPFNK